MRGVLIALLAAGCGGGEERPAVDGAWSVINESTGCGLGLGIDGAFYSIQFLCLLKGGGVGADVELGDFQVNSEQIGFAPRRASCLATDHPNRVFHYGLAGDTLSLIDDGGVLVFKKVDSGKGSGRGEAVEFGCWHDNGTFTPSPLRDI